MASPARKRKATAHQLERVFRKPEEVVRGLNKTIKWLREQGAQEITLEELEDSLSKVREPAHKTIRRLRDEEG